MIWHTIKHVFETMKTSLNIGSSYTNIERDCVATTAKAMPFAFLRSRFEREFSSKQLAETMAKSIKEAYKENFGNLHWLDDETRLLLKDKLDAMSSQ